MKIVERNYLYTFVIPHKNTPFELSRCIDSIPLRDDIQIIVVDDDSKADKKPKVNRPDVQIICLEASTSRGAGQARNVGLRHALGRWVLFADADDYYLPGFLDRLDAVASQAAEIVYFSADYIRYGKQLEEDNPFKLAIDRFKGSAGSLSDVRFLCMSNNTVWNRMYSRKFLLDINARFEAIPLGNDVWFSTYVGSKCHSVEIIEDKLYCYQLTAEGITGTNHPMSHYYRCGRTLIRRNMLLLSLGLWPLISFSVFHAARIQKDHGKFAYGCYWFFLHFCDPTLIPVMILRFCKSHLR